MLYLAIATFFIFAYLALRKPLYALVGLCALLPSYLLRFEIFNLPSTILEVIIWAIFFGYILSFPRRRESFNLVKSRLLKIKYPFALFFVASIVAIFVSPNLFQALGVWRAYFLEAGLVFILFLAIIKDRQDFKKIIFGLSLSALYISLYAIGQRLTLLPIPEPWQSELRATGIFPYPNAIGLFLAPIIILMIGQIKKLKKYALYSAYYILISLLSFIAIVVAQSDGAIFATIGAIIIFIILNLLTNKKYKTGIAIIILVLIAGGLLFGTLAPVQEKILLKDWSGIVRENIWRETINMLKDNWFFGAGLSGYQTVIIPYHESRKWMEIFMYPHNIILNFWSEIGLLGLAGFIWLLEKFGKMCYKLLSRFSPPFQGMDRGGSEKTYIITAISAMAALLIHGLVDVPYFKNELAILFWIIFSMPLITRRGGSSG